MKNLIIPRGKRRPRNRSLLPNIYVNKSVIEASYNFLGTCRYYLPGEDQHDINKLIGLSFSLSPHDNSIRIGWRYVPTVDKIELLLYMYVDGVRQEFKHLTYMNFNARGVIRWTRISDSWSTIWINGAFYEVEIPGHWPNGISYALGIYFGGNRPAPHRMEIVKYEKPFK
jgi:hypothetical protein